MGIWINCSEQLPSVGQKVLVRIPVSEHHNIENAEYRGNGKFLCAWLSTRGEGCTYGVSHWMNIPAEPEVKLRGKYDRKIIGYADDGKAAAVNVDVYDVLKAFAVTDPALQHLIKKALCAGLRGHKDIQQDLIDIRESSVKALANFCKEQEIYNKDES